ncbi:Receptor-type tyrosine-protein phosphatase N2 [Aphelenchoides bicaudatus]|nr:Receptor-type tyrosine-protein phosphatase N2 [Aphelenchoides bicaudatus]
MLTNFLYSSQNVNLTQQNKQRRHTLTQRVNCPRCLLDDSLCDGDEVCVQDGLFGQCYSSLSADAVPPILLDEDLTVQQVKACKQSMFRKHFCAWNWNASADEGLDWRHERSQCILAYFKISVSYNLNYDTEFCTVRNPGNILALVQKVQGYLSEEEENANLAAATLEDIPVQTVDEDLPVVVEQLPVIIEDEKDQEAEEPFKEAVIVDKESGDAVPVVLVDEELVEQVLDEAENTPDVSEPIVIVDDADIVEDDNSTSVSDAKQLTEASMAKKEPKDKRESDDSGRPLTKDEDKELNQFVTDTLNNGETKVHELSTPQLEKLVRFIGSLQQNLEDTEVKEENEGAGEEPKELPEVNAELEEVIPLTSAANAQQLLMKKDPEKFGNDDMGLANIEHKIVKGDIHRVEGNRVYIKVGKEQITEDELYRLISYLDKKIAEPNNLYFNEFQYENGQLSFHISKLDSIRRQNDKRVDSASRVAQAVYKRRKDIQTLAGVQVDETGIGSGDDVVPVERSGRDWLFMPILTVCAFTITSLIVVLAVHMYRNRRRSYKGNLPEILDHLNGKTSTAYEELCRQRMNSQDIPIAVGKSASTSSWPDESVLQSCNLDISTGHVILSFLQEYLDSPQKIADQWESVVDYTNASAETTIGEREENREKNADQSVLPYDETIVNVPSGNGYINASKIYDSDLRQVAYIATQAPLESTVNDFWHCIWKEGITLIVNLCDQQDALHYQRYWPDEGAKSFGIFEVHLVSEHIWSEDYMVRSFYLKNTETNETRTVTQFHYLVWPENGVPASLKSLLEFRRKVNKSYRGKASPVLVHCVKGTARTGAYCLIDIVVNRITKGAGIKELNIAGSLEHLRDQRMGMVGNLEQYQLAYSCVADEVQALLKNLQQQQQ